MSFWDRFESNKEGVNDTVEFVVRVAIVTLSAVILVVVVALVAGLFLPDHVVDSSAILDMINPAFQTIIGAFVGLLGGLSLNANARDAKPEEPAPVDVEPQPTAEEVAGPAPVVSQPEEATPVVSQEEPVLADDDDDMEPWEKYRNDLRYDANGDGVVDENDFPDWRNPDR